MCHIFIGKIFIMYLCSYFIFSKQIKNKVYFVHLIFIFDVLNGNAILLIASFYALHYSWID